MEMVQHQEMSMEQKLEKIRQQLQEMQATQDILVNYMQAVALSLGLKEKIKELDARLDEIRSGLDLDDDRDTKP